MHDGQDMTLDVSAAALAGLSLGALSAAHCTVMCGPVAMVGRAHGRSDAALAYFAGRFASYVALGALGGGLGAALLATPWASALERVFPWLLVGALLWAALQAFVPRAESKLVTLGRGPRRTGLARVLARLAEEPLLLGAATVFLPCSTSLLALSSAAAAGSALAGATMMSMFCVVTGLAIVGLGGLVERLLGGRARRLTIAAALVLGAGLTLLRPVTQASSRADTCPLHARGTP